MGKLVDGKWSNEWYKASAKGDFVRDETQFRNTLSADGASGFEAEAGRYHLYVSLACPWAHRTLIARELKGLHDAIGVSVVHPHMGEQGWEFGEFPGATPDLLHGAKYLYEIYTRAKSDYSGRVTVPVLWDRNGSADLCPRELTAAVDAEIDALYAPVNNGVYRAGFAVQQSAYESATRELFSALDGYEARLEKQRYLLGSALTEADICLFTTLLRFDPVYHYHFKCNLRRIADYPALSGYVRDIYQTPGVAETCNFEHIKHHYFTSHPTINPNKIIPLGPVLDLLAPHGRA
jgi:putative glutathione S-transferase